MRKETRYALFGLSILLLMFWVVSAAAEVYDQCPCYRANPVTGKPDPSLLKPGAAYNPVTQNVECKNVVDMNGVRHADVACKALTAGDGHAIMGDDNDIYIFGFHEVTGVKVDDVLNMVNDPMAPGGMRGAEASAPSINAKAGQEFYLSLTNAGMMERPDLADPHTVHNHGFPNASSVFDGEPMASMGVNMGETLTYYYNFVEPGTYMYHCHVEASEHMQMGMLGNLNVRPQQDGQSHTYKGKTYKNFAYNDCQGSGGTSNASCGSTGYDVAYPLEVTAFDPDFHHSDNSYNDIDFAAMKDTYQLFNGRGYPYTVNSCGRQSAYPLVPTNYPACSHPEQLYSQILSTSDVNVSSQNVSALITAKLGQKILIHFPSLATSDFNTITLLGLPMQIVGQGARQYKGPTGLTYYNNAKSITLGGGEGFTILIDTTGAKPGTYFMYSTNLNQLSNDAQDYGGLMTEIVIN